MKDFSGESLCHDPIHGYMPFVAQGEQPSDEVVEQQLIDHPWVQRLRQIHQLQTAWWVFPTAEHTRFQHVLGVMQLASRAVDELYDSLREVCDDVPSRPYVETLMRMAALLHDVGHGPFGHFFDEHFLRDYDLTHESLGCVIIEQELGDLLRALRRNPHGRLADNEQLDPAQVAYLIRRPKEDDDRPRWLRMLRGLFSGLYTVDNMDFVLRDAYMTGYSARAFDLERLLHYSFFTAQGLTIHERGLGALVRFIEVRAALFRSIYFHRAVRAIDLSLQELFAGSKSFLFPGNPVEHLEAYQGFTEWTLLNDVAKWSASDDAKKRAWGDRWRALLRREYRWQMVCERTRYFEPHETEQGSIFSNESFVVAAIREQLPKPLKSLSLRVDLPRHIHRPGTRGPAPGQNFFYDASTGEVRNLTDNALFKRLPLSYRICRVYAETNKHNAEIATALDKLLSPGGVDDVTNM